jgi:hypothetical protein
MVAALGQVDRIIAGVEDEPRQRFRGRQPRKHSADLLGSGRVDVRVRPLPANAHGSGPPVGREAQVGNPGLGPTGNNRLASRMPRGVGVDRPLRTGRSITAHPDTGSNSLKGFAVRERLRSERRLKRRSSDCASGQRGRETAPATSVQRVQAQVRRRRDRSSGQERITPVQQRIPTMSASGVQRRAQSTK